MFVISNDGTFGCTDCVTDCTRVFCCTVSTLYDLTGSNVGLNSIDICWLFADLSKSDDGIDIISAIWVVDNID